MTDEFDELIARSLHSGAGEVPIETPGFQDVRHRVRRRRQRRMAMTSVPVLAGVAFLGSRHPGNGTAHVADAGTTTVFGESPTSTLDFSTTTTLGVLGSGYRCLAASETGSDGEWVYYSACEPSFGVGSAPPGVDTTVEATTATSTTETPGSCQAGWYEIQAGDWPAKVATVFDLTVEELDAANASTPGYDTFYVGLRIVIPCPSAISPTSGTTTTTPPTTTTTFG